MHFSDSYLTYSLGLVGFVIVGLVVQFIVSYQLRRLFYHAHSQQTQELQQHWQSYRRELSEQHFMTLKQLQDSTQIGLGTLQQQLNQNLQQTLRQLSEQMQQLNLTTENRLQSISKQVEQRLSEGFAQTTATFTSVVQRLAMIDEAQKKMTELSGQVMSLQEILSDKRSRGALGESQLSQLIGNLIPAPHYALQHTLSNHHRVDCMLFLPSPSGNLAIDAKFPLETFRRLMEKSISDYDQKKLEQQFRVDIKKHIHDIADKYIHPPETATGAVMFIPAEAVFAEIHAYYPDLVEEAQRCNVWLASPTTMMAILTTARAVIKDQATQQQVHLIRDHLQVLAVDFNRFQTRLDQLARHIDQAHDDVHKVNQSAKKITARFQRIERVEVSEPALQLETLLDE